MSSENLINQGVALGQQGKLDEAIALFRQAVVTDPAHPRAHLNLGIALLATGHPQESLASVDRSIALRDNELLSHHARMKALIALNRVEEAVAAGRRALQIDPNHAETHGVLAKVLLTLGDFKRGWAEYEWRWKCESFRDPIANFQQPRWTGGKIAGKTILVLHEQGFGDAIQFMRYVPLLAERGADVIVRCPREIADLVRRMRTSPQVLLPGELPPPFHFYIPLLSLPLAMNTTMKTIPADVPYFSASAHAANIWRQRVEESAGDNLRVGIAWAGRQVDDYGRAKSMKLEMLAPLASSRITFYSLQKWNDASSPPPGLHLVDLTSKIVDFSDSAGLIENMDLVISVDTVIAHLAGAMAKPIWTLLPFAADFRWFLQREDSPWYPTMRLFRQSRPFDWASVLARVADELASLARVR